MNLLPFIKKDDNDLPDSYGIKIVYIDGRTEEFEVASHRIIESTSVFEFVTHEDLWNLVPLSAIKRVEFNKQFSKIVEIANKKNDQKS